MMKLAGKPSKSKMMKLAGKPSKMVNMKFSDRIKPMERSECVDTLQSGSAPNPAENCVAFKKYCKAESWIGEKIRDECADSCGLC